MPHKPFIIFYIITPFIYIGLFFWGLIASFDTPISLQSILRALLFIVTVFVVGMHIYTRSKVNKTPGIATCMRIISDLIFIFSFLYLAVVILFILSR